MVHLVSTIVAFKTATLILGGLITLFAYRAYRRTASRSLGRLAVGFAVITLGSLVAGIADQFTSLSTVHALLIESGLTAAGLAVILHALYVD